MGSLFVGLLGALRSALRTRADLVIGANLRKPRVSDPDERDDILTETLDFPALPCEGSRA
jgi:hypothetical protein